MGTRAAAWLAWSVCALSLILISLGLLFLALNRSHPGAPAFEFAFRATVITASCSSVGVLIATRRPAHPIGWLFGVVGLLSGVHLFAGEYAVYALVVEGGSMPGGRLSAWITCWLWVPINAVLAFVALLFPDGKLPSPRWRPVAWLNGAMAVAGASAAAFLPGPTPWIGAVDNPFGAEGLGAAKNLIDGTLEALSYGVFGLAGVVSLFFRFRRAGRVEREQIKWFAYAGAVLLLGAVLLYAGPESIRMAWIRQIGFALWFVGFVGLPVAIGIAILRYRLYEIDIIINRTLVYGALTVAMAIVFEAIDATLHYFLVTIAHVHTLPGSIVAALVVGALFDPVRHRIQRFVNRYLYPGEAGAPGRPEGAGPPKAVRASRSLPFPSRSSNFPGVNPVAPYLATAPEGVAGHRAFSHAQKATLRVASPTWRGSGSSGSRPFLPPLRTRFRRVRSQGAILRSPPQALRYSVVSVSHERQPALTPLHRSARTRRGRQRAQRGVLRRGFACAILCARKGDCDEIGERAAMARRSKEGKTIHRTPGGQKGAGRPRRWTSGPGSPGRAWHVRVSTTA